MRHKVEKKDGRIIVTGPPETLRNLGPVDLQASIAQVELAGVNGETAASVFRRLSFSGGDQ